VLNKSFVLTADVVIPERGAEGMVFTIGGLTGGFGLYVREGRAHFVYNFLAIDRATVTSEPLPQGPVKLAVRFDYDGRPGEFGKPAKVSLAVNGREAGAGRIPHTIPLAISLGEGLDVGTDTGSAVDFTYGLPFTFTGTIEQVAIDLP
jgi:arylsulfatase